MHISGLKFLKQKFYYDEIGVLLREMKRINDKFDLNLNEINMGGGLRHNLYGI